MDRDLIRRSLRRTAVPLVAAACCLLSVAPGANAAAGDVGLVAAIDNTGHSRPDSDVLIPSISGSGDTIAFAESPAGGDVVMRRDMSSGAATVVHDPPDSGSYYSVDANSPSISADGRLIAFVSNDPTLSGKPASRHSEALRAVYLHPLGGGFRLVSRRSGRNGEAANNHTEMPSISADGRYVAFSSMEANNLFPKAFVIGGLFVRDLRRERTIPIAGTPGISGFLPSGSEPSLSGDGSRVAFTSAIGPLRKHRGPFPGHTPEVVVRGLGRSLPPLIASRAGGRHGRQANGDCGEASISADGRYVAFASTATNLTGNDDPNVEDVFRRDLRTGRTQLVSRASGAGGRPGNGDSSRPSISADGRYLAFQSVATDLGPADAEGLSDVFIKDMQTGEVRLASHGEAGEPADGASYSPSISADGRFVAFLSKASNLSPAHPTRTLAVFRYQALG